MQAAEPIRLNKFIASRLNLGRRAADDVISRGRVTINGKQVELGARVMPGDVVTVDGKPLPQTTAAMTYVLMDKPTGYVCSRAQQDDAPTIYNLLPSEYQHLKTVGRLDKDSSGLILLTNDGDYAHRLTHPSYVKTKRYEVVLDKPLEPLHHQMISDHGIQLPDGPSHLELQRQHDGNSTHWLVTMHEGRNRQIRRTFAALGYTVVGLRRTHFGPYSLAQLNGRQLQAVNKQ